MSINNYPFDVAFVRGVTELTGGQISALKSLGLDYDPYECPDPSHLQVWCGSIKAFSIVNDDCVRDALSYEDEDVEPKLFFNNVEDLVAALS